MIFEVRGKSYRWNIGKCLINMTGLAMLIGLNTAMLIAFAGGL